MTTPSEALEKVREALDSANNTYLGGEYVYCIKPELVEEALTLLPIIEGAIASIVQPSHSDEERAYDLAVSIGYSGEATRYARNKIAQAFAVIRADERAAIEKVKP